jgi:hypothetical protein
MSELAVIPLLFIFCLSDMYVYVVITCNVLVPSQLSCSDMVLKCPYSRVACRTTDFYIALYVDIATCSLFVLLCSFFGINLWRANSVLPLGSASRISKWS